MILLYPSGCHTADILTTEFIGFELTRHDFLLRFGTHSCVPNDAPYEALCASYLLCADYFWLGCLNISVKNSFAKIISLYFSASLS